MNEKERTIVKRTPTQVKVKVNVKGIKDASGKR